VETKVCKDCKENKPINEFYKDQRRKDGHSPRCRECEHNYRSNENREKRKKETDRRKKLFEQGIKVCSKCGQDKSLSDFYHQNKLRSGHDSWCKSCRELYAKQNIDYYNSYREDYQNKNKEKIRESQRKHYDKNRDELLAKHREYYQKNKEVLKEKQALYNKERKDSIRQYKKEHHLKNREKAIESSSRRKEGFRQKIHNYYGGECYICHLSDNHFEIYDCHHVQPDQKDYAISTMIGKDWDTIVLLELQKCIYICANCHRKLTKGRFNDALRNGDLILIPGGKEDPDELYNRIYLYNGPHYSEIANS
jgi:hypothetical protein